MIPYYVLETIAIGPLVLHVWGLFAGLAFAVALFLAIKEAADKKISEETIWDLAVLILIGGVVGARLAFIMENWDYFNQNINEILSLKEGGLMFYGGALGAIALVAGYFKFKKIDGWRVLDILVPSFAAGEFIGRIGCALGDLHIGAVTSLPWAQKYLDGSARHPIAIYMSLNGLAMLVFFWLIRTRVKIKGALFIFFLIWYSGTRFFLDFLRCGDLNICDPRYWGFTPSQYISAGVFIISLVYLFNIFNHPPTGGKKHMEEQQKHNASDGGNVKNKNIQGSVVSFTEAEEVFIEAGGSAEKKNANAKSMIEKIKSIAQRKDALNFIGKKSWVMPLALIAAIAGGAGFASMYYGNMFKKDIFSFRGKTWISYSDPIVNLKIVNDKNCANCDTGDIVNQIKSGAIPTLAVQKVDFNSSEGKKFIESFKIKSLPALIFDASVEKVAIFEKIKNILEAKDNFYYLSSIASGVPIGKLLETPKVTSEDRVKGPESAPVTIVEFSDFKCPYCKQENETLKQVLSAYPDKVRLVYKHLPLSIHPEAQYAAEAAECAGDQGKFWEMANMFFDKQDKLDKDSIAKYARDLRLDTGKFKECADGGKFKAKVDNDAKIAVEFGVAGTPSVFIGDEFFGNTLTFEQFKQAIDAKLAK